MTDVQPGRGRGSDGTTKGTTDGTRGAPSPETPEPGPAPDDPSKERDKEHHREHHRERKGNRRGGRGERTMVPDAEFRSYYGRPILKPPVWEARDIAGYLFLGGLAGASSVLGAGADLTGRRRLEAASKSAALGAVSLSVAALVHDLGRPARFVNMLRTFKPTSPMSVGSWLLAGYGPAAGVAAVTALTGTFPRVGRVATAGAALLGPAVASYTAVLVADTALPAWHDGYREMPFLFTGSAASAAGGFGMLAAPLAEAAPARRAALFGSVVDLAAATLMERRMGELVAEPYRRGRSGVLVRVGKALTAAGAAGAALGRRHRAVSAASGVALLAGSAVTRFGIFAAGEASAQDPRYTIVPQRERLAAAQRP